MSCLRLKSLSTFIAKKKADLVQLSRAPEDTGQHPRSFPRLFNAQGRNAGVGTVPEPRQARYNPCAPM
jgi:hypothetical protein